MVGEVSSVCAYSANFCGLLLQIASVIDNYAATLQKRADRDCFFMATQGIVQLVQRYRNGIRGHMKSVVQDLLRQYLRVELQFQHGERLGWGRGGGHVSMATGNSHLCTVIV